MVVRTDKNLGPVVLDRSAYIKRCLQDHIIYEDTYRIITQDEAVSEFDEFHEDMSDFFKTKSRYLLPPKVQYLHNSCWPSKISMPTFMAH